MAPNDGEGAGTIVRLVGVYDADGSVVGELSYFLKARLGTAHCALCDITHGLLRERATWRQRRSTLPVPFDTFHRDDQPDGVRGAGGAAPPVVVAETDDGRFLQLLEAHALAACEGSPERLVDAVEAARISRDLRWPEPIGAE